MTRSARSSGHRSLRRILGVALVGTAAVSMAAVTVLNFAVTDRLLRDDIVEELGAIQDSRAQAIGVGIGQIMDTVAILAADRTVVDALVGFRDGVAELDAGESRLDPAERARVETYYRDLLADPDLAARLAATGLDLPSADQAVPDDVASYLQLHYLVDAPDGRDARAAIDDPGDGSRYTEVHARFHPSLRERASTMQARDVMLVTAEDPRVVYTVGKGPDLGTDPVNGIFADGDLRDVLVDGLPRVAAGEPVAVDVRPYLGAAGEPLLFVAAAVLDGRELVGAVVVQFPVDRLNLLMTAGGRWDEVGLGATGETFVVGRDLRLRSEVRSWIEDPDGHLADLRSRGLDEVADAAAALGTTVSVESVASPHVRAALDGRRFVGASTNSRSDDVFATAAPLGVAGLDWVVVAEISRSEATDASRNQLVLLAVLVVVGILAVAAVGSWLARMLARPVPPLLAAAERVADGDLEVDLDDRSRDEFGYLARRLRSYASALSAQEEVLREQHRAVDELFGALLPTRTVAAVRDGATGPCELSDTATVVVVTIDGVPEVVDSWSFEQAVALGADLEHRAAAFGLERVWSSVDRHMFLAGLDGDDDPGHDVAGALGFLDAVMSGRPAGAEAEDEDGTGFGFHAAVATGRVQAGVVGERFVAFGVWGPPVRETMALETLGAPGQVLVHASASDTLGGPVEELIHGTRRREVVVISGEEWAVDVIDVATASSPEHVQS